MAMALVQLAAATSDTSNVSTYTGTSGAPAVGDLVIVVFYVTGYAPGSVGRSPIISGGGYTWKIEHILEAGTGNVDRVFVATTIATSVTAIAPSISTFATCTGCMIKGSRITGLEGQSQLYTRQSATASGTTANPVITLPNAALTGNGMWGVIVNLANAANFSAPSGWTSHFEIAMSTPSADIMTFYRVSGFTGTSVNVTSAQTVQWNAYVAELYNVGTGPTEGGSIIDGMFNGITAI
jgi:hypothetical protein